MTKRTAAKPEVLTKKQLSRREREQRQLRLLYIGAAVVGVLILGVLAIGLYQELVRKPASPVARVAGVPIRTDQYEKMLAYRQMNLEDAISQVQYQLQSYGPAKGSEDFVAQYYQQQLQYLRSELENAPEQTLEEMIDSELIRQETERLAISVSDEEIQLETERQFGYDRNPPTPTPTPITATVPITATPTPTIVQMTQQLFEERYVETLKRLKERVNFSEQDLRDLIRASLRRRKLQQYLADQLPKTELQVHARHILLKTQEEADAALARLNAGEDFATLAKELSIDENTREEGGDLGWFPMGLMDSEFEKVAFNLPVGQISEVFQTSYGFHIVKVEEKDENRELDASILEQRKEGLVESWLGGKRYSDAVERILEFGTEAAQ